MLLSLIPTSVVSKIDVWMDAGDVSLPAGMTLRMLWEPEENTSMDIITCFGAFDSSGTTWSIDAGCPARWSVKTTQNAILARYTKPGMVVTIQ